MSQTKFGITNDTAMGAAKLSAGVGILIHEVLKMHPGVSGIDAAVAVAEALGGFVSAVGGRETTDKEVSFVLAGFIHGASNGFQLMDSLSAEEREVMQRAVTQGARWINPELKSAINGANMKKISGGGVVDDEAADRPKTLGEAADAYAGYRGEAQAQIEAEELAEANAALAAQDGATL